LPPGNNPAQGVKDLSGAGVVAAGILPRRHQPTRRPAPSVVVRVRIRGAPPRRQLPTPL